MDGATRRPASGLKSAARVQPPGGWRSDTKRKPERPKRGANLKKTLDSPVGCNELLGGSPSVGREKE